MFDLAVIGGGVSGLGVALEAARKNARVVLLEKSALCSATSANSLRIIHGGLRYLQHLDLIRSLRSRRDQAFLLQWAPECITPLDCYLPLSAAGLKSKPFAMLGAALYGALQRLGGVSVAPCRVVGDEEVSQRAPEFGDLFRRGALYWQDALVSELDRFHQLLKHTCESSSVDLREGAQVEALEPKGDSFEINLRRRNGAETLQARKVVNCAGPWLAGVRPKRLETLPLPRWCKAFNLVLRKRLLSECAVALPCERGRMLFVVNRGETSVLGTWYLPFEGSPDALALEEREFMPMLESFNRLCPRLHLSPADIDGYDCGVLPMREVRDGEPVLFGSEAMTQCGNYLEVLSTKYTTFRSQGQAAVARLFKQA